MKRKHTPFRSAHEEVSQQKNNHLPPQPDAYRLAFTDQEFLLRENLRPIRLQLELLKPEMSLVEHHIISTVVVFGSARILSPEFAKKRLQMARKMAKAEPEQPLLAQALHQAERALENSRYYQLARDFTHELSLRYQKKKDDLTQTREFVIVTGGGPGIMEAGNRGAHEAKAESIALNIALPFEQNPNPYVTPDLSFQFHYFAIRKMHFLIRAKALAAFPGGFGTLDELFEALTLLQTQKIKPMPIVLFGKDFWSRVINLEVLVEEGMIHEADLKLFQFVESAQEACDYIQDFYRGK